MKAAGEKMQSVISNGLHMRDSLQWRRLFWIATVVSFCSMFFINFFTEGFIITVSVIVLPILLYWYKPEKWLALGVILGIASPGFRWFTLILSGDTAISGLYKVWPEFFFYLCYSTIYYFWYARRKRNIGNFAAAVILSDFLSNWLELGLRLFTVLIPFEYFRGIASIALIRTIVVVLVVLLINGVQRYSAKEAQKAHYEKLLLLTANFWSEIYFLEKNSVFIENLMAKAFTLYNHSKNLPDDLASKEEFEALALDVAKEVHEVKKDYRRVIQGLEAITEKKLYDLEMSMGDILRVVIENTRHVLDGSESRGGDSGKRIQIVERLHSNALVRYHFYMTSVIRNLIGNAIESFEGQRLGKIEIDLVEDLERVTLIISDNGSGILEKNLPFIFNPGFSTKYESETGQSKRGVGLVVVKSLVEQVFCGTIDVSTSVGRGTSFTLTFDVACLKEGRA